MENFDKTVENSPETVEKPIETLEKSEKRGRSKKFIENNFKNLTKEEHRAICSKGGKVRQENIKQLERARRSRADIVDAVAEMLAKKPKSKGEKAIAAAYGLGDEAERLTLLVYGLYAACFERGDPRAVKLVVDLLAETETSKGGGVVLLPEVAEDD